MDAFSKLVHNMQGEGPRLFSSWNRELFAEFCRGPALSLWHSLQKQKINEKVFAAYMKLVQEAVGAMYIHQVSQDCDKWQNLLEFFLVKKIPRSLEMTSKRRQLSLLIKLWNLGEGLLQEPAWVNHYVISQIHELDNLEKLEEFLIRVLKPVVNPPNPAGWQGPFRVLVVNTRDLYDKFLPGEMQLVAPTVLSIRDRREPEVNISLFLRHKGNSRFIGVTSYQASYDEDVTNLKVKFAENRVCIQQNWVQLPYLQYHHSHAITLSGFLVASALDSQRLWILESP